MLWACVRPLARHSHAAHFSDRIHPARLGLSAISAPLPDQPHVPLVMEIASAPYISNLLIGFGLLLGVIYSVAAAPNLSPRLRMWVTLGCSAAWLGVLALGLAIHPAILEVGMLALLLALSVIMAIWIGLFDPGIDG